MGGSDQGRAMLAGVAQERQQRRALSGRGRRGRTQAVETAFGMATGGSLSEMEFDLGGGRSISGGDRNAAGRLAGILRGGGEQAASVRAQLQSQLESNGLSQSGASDLVNTLSSGLQGGGRGVGNIDQLIRMTGTGETGAALERIQTQAVERQQRSRDPLGVQRNETLSRMETLLGRIRDRLPASSEPTGEAG
jgi:hypothetical protein